MRYVLFLSAWCAGLGPLLGVQPLNAQELSVQELSARVVELERRVAELESRLVALEARLQPSANVQPSPTGADWRNLANWRRLRRGMSMAEVRSLLGEPEKVDAGMVLIYWYWDYPGGGNVIFDARTNKLNGWSEPS